MGKMVWQNNNTQTNTAMASITELRELFDDFLKTPTRLKRIALGMLMEAHEGDARSQNLMAPPPMEPETPRTAEYIDILCQCFPELKQLVEAFTPEAHARFFTVTLGGSVVVNNATLQAAYEKSSCAVYSDQPIIALWKFIDRQATKEWVTKDQIHLVTSDHVPE